MAGRGERAPLLLIAAGGTGGHMFPAQALAEAMIAKGWRVKLSTDPRGARYAIAFPEEVVIEEISSATFARGGAAAKLAVPFRIAGGVLGATGQMLRDRPTVVVGFGGYPTIPALSAATILRIPRMIHEQNGVLGKVNTAFASRVDAVACGTWPTALPDGVAGIHTGNPVRQAVLDRAGAGYIAPGDYPMSLLVIGGSQGARVLNETLPAALALLAAGERPEVWHQGGAREFEACRERYRERGVAARTTAFIDDMVAAYEWADVVVCRAGALTVSELAAAGLAAILVPLPTAIDDHQSMNARWLADAGAALAVAQAAFTPEWLAAQLSRWSAARDDLLLMATRARALAMPRAADAVAANCLEVAR